MGVVCGLTMFTKQVSGPLDSGHSPPWQRRPGRSSELEERPAHGPNPSFCALQADRTNALTADTITSFCVFTLTRQHPQDPFLVTSSGTVALGALGAGPSIRGDSRNEITRRSLPPPSAQFRLRRIPVPARGDHPLRSAGTYGSASPTGTPRNCWPSAGSRSTMSRSSGGSNASPRSSPRPHELDTRRPKGLAASRIRFGRALSKVFTPESWLTRTHDLRADRPRTRHSAAPR
jgi:hypothetical protein